MHPTHRHRFVFGAFLAFIALALLFGIVRCGASSDDDNGVKVRAIGRYEQSWTGPATTEAPATEAAETLPSAEGFPPPAPIAEPTVPPVERPQSFTADGDDGAAWACLAVLESGNGRDSANIWGILDRRVYSMSRGEQLAYARRIRDRTGGYLVGWPNTGAECGLG